MDAKLHFCKKCTHFYVITLINKKNDLCIEDIAVIIIGENFIRYLNSYYINATIVIFKVFVILFKEMYISLYSQLPIIISTNMIPILGKYASYIPSQCFNK